MSPPEFTSILRPAVGECMQADESTHVQCAWQALAQYLSYLPAHSCGATAAPKTYQHVPSLYRYEYFVQCVHICVGRPILTMFTQACSRVSKTGRRFTRAMS